MTTRHNIGTWDGPGILILRDGHWMHVDPDRLTASEVRALKEHATACVGRDAPRIDIVKALPPETIAP